jgi:hypothetical protein
MPKKSTQEPAEATTTLEDLAKRITSLEAKIDTLIARTPAVPAIALVGGGLEAAFPEGPHAVAAAAGPEAVQGLAPRDFAGLQARFVGTKAGNPAVSQDHTMDRTAALLWWEVSHNADTYDPSTEFPVDVMFKVSNLTRDIRDKYFNDVGSNIRQSNLVAAKTYIKLWSAIHGSIREANKLS